MVTPKFLTWLTNWMSERLTHSKAGTGCAADEHLHISSTACIFLSLSCSLLSVIHNSTSLTQSFISKTILWTRLGVHDHCSCVSSAKVWWPTGWRRKSHQVAHVQKQDRPKHRTLGYTIPKKRRCWPEATDDNNLLSAWQTGPKPSDCHTTSWTANAQTPHIQVQNYKIILVIFLKMVWIATPPPPQARL